MAPSLLLPQPYDYQTSSTERNQLSRTAANDHTTSTTHVPAQRAKKAPLHNSRLAWKLQRRAFFDALNVKVEEVSHDCNL